MNNNLENNLISIIIPIYNSEKYLPRCIESVINQDYKNIETILINDGSIDNSEKICNKYVLNDNRIKLINTSNNGQSSARNKGIKTSKGEFIFFIDSDDYIENNALGSLIKDYEKNETDLIIGDFRKINEKNAFINSGHERFFLDSKLLTQKDTLSYVEEYLKKPNRFPLFVYSWGRLFKSSIIKKNNIFFNTGISTFEDVAFNFDYLKYSNRISFVNNPIYDHQIYDNYSSATMTIGNNPKKLFGYKYALKKVRDYLENQNCNTDIKEVIGHADVCYTIIQLVRTCGQIDKNNKKQVYEYIDEVINEKEFRNNLQYYSPSKGDSKILPILMKLKLVSPIMKVCEYKAYKRYKRGFTLR